MAVECSLLSDTQTPIIVICPNLIVQTHNSLVPLDRFVWSYTRTYYPNISSSGIEPRPTNALLQLFRFRLLFLVIFIAVDFLFGPWFPVIVMKEYMYSTVASGLFLSTITSYH